MDLLQRRLKMEQLFEKLKEYLGMETEISYEEFESYYQKVIAAFSESYESFNQDEAVKGRFILSILMSNSEDRAKRYKNLSKKYRKMYDKCHLWAEALTLRLLKMGMTKDQILQAEQELHDSV
jgi:16S rRNA C1402 (ribose-2'-O) methylase RsmI